RSPAALPGMSMSAPVLVRTASRTAPNVELSVEMVSCSPSQVTCGGTGGISSGVKGRGVGARSVSSTVGCSTAASVLPGALSPSLGCCATIDIETLHIISASAGRQLPRFVDLGVAPEDIGKIGLLPDGPEWRVGDSKRNAEPAPGRTPPSVGLSLILASTAASSLRIRKLSPAKPKCTPARGLYA